MRPVIPARLACRVSLVAATATLVAACGAATSPTAAPSTEGSAAFSPRPAAGIPGALLPNERKLWTYDASAGTYNVVDGDASAPYVPNIRKPTKPLTFAFAEGWAAIPFSVAINKGIYKIAGEQGIEIIYCDQEFKPEKAVTCAEQLSQQKPDFAIVSNWQSGAAEAIMKIYDAARIPVVNIDVWHPNGIFFGADNYVSGQIGGRAAADYAKAQGKCAEVTIFLGISPGEGDAANQRLAGFQDGVQEVCGAIPADRIKSEIIDAGTTEQALTKTTDWLTANPGASFVLSTTIDDARSAGVAKALAQSNRAGVAVGLGCDDIGVASTKEGDPAQTHFLGCVAYFPEKYPDYVMSIGLDVLDGKPVPNEVHIEHKFLDKASIGAVYP
ncbi:MAG TPA: sugar ABC transporter substrate-binding protein [Candidatus Limnocylindrales bacterium]|nr:sugar ABC transporter substrate-binding protein [Candidatus Limnocylindrales bacterium]